MAAELQDVSDTLVGAFQNPGLLIGIPLALLGAVFMSFGAQYQHRGVTKVERMSGSTRRRRPDRCAAGATADAALVGASARSCSALAIVCQLGALSFAPLIVVQPLGAIALVITTLLNAQISGHQARPSDRSSRSPRASAGSSSSSPSPRCTRPTTPVSEPAADHDPDPARRGHDRVRGPVALAAQAHRARCSTSSPPA